MQIGRSSLSKRFLYRALSSHPLFSSFSLFPSTSLSLFLSFFLSFFLSLSLFLLAFVSSLLCLLSLYLSVPITFSSFWFWPFLSSLLVSSYLFFSLLPSLFSSFFPSLSLALSLLLYLSLMSLSFLTQTHKSTKADSKCIHLSGFNILPVKASEPYPVRADRPLFPSFPLPYSPVSPKTCHSLVQKNLEQKERQKTLVQEERIKAKAKRSHNQKTNSQYQVSQQARNPQKYRTNTRTKQANKKRSSDLANDGHTRLEQIELSSPQI